MALKNNPDRIAIEYSLTFETLFHCGTGIREGLIDRTVVRDSRSYLYIPGSTFKGVLRERCEQLARFYTSDEDKTANKSIASPHDADAALEELGKQRPTIITRIFGSQATPGRLFFDDARQDNLSPSQHNTKTRSSKNSYTRLQVTPYTQVRLDRPTRTAVPGALYTSEFGINNITFNGSIQGWLHCSPIDESSADLLPTYSLLLLLAGLQLIERLGGNKSTGKGKCSCTITSVKINKAEYPQAVWQGWFEKLETLTGYLSKGGEDL